MDSSRREARQTGGGPNVVGGLDDEAILILAADKDLSTTATERITEMLEGTPAFSGITGSADLFEGPSNSLPEELVIESSSMIIDAQEVLVNNSFTVGIRPRKRKRSAEKSSVRSLSASDLLPLQQEVLCKQMEVFSAQLALSMYLSTNLNLSEYDLSTYLVLKYVLNFLVIRAQTLFFPITLLYTPMIPLNQLSDKRT